MDTEIRLLGPVGVSAGGVARPLPGLRRKAVLAVLAVHTGQPVSTDRIVDVVWGDRPPATVVNALQNVVSYLRRFLGGADRIVAGAATYTLRVPVDASRAEDLIRRAAGRPDPAERAGLLRDAVALWHGEALSDVAVVPYLREQRDRLEQLRVDALEGLGEARLALGEHAETVAELTALAELHPFRERLHQHLMVALYRSGRQADALAVYRRLHRTMADELGVGPGPEIRDTEQAILRQDQALAAHSAVPAQLPRATAAFAGRATELALIGRSTGGLVVISGSAGIGKTSLAVQWAHDAVPRYPDGQLYVNLRGFDPGARSMPAAEALGGFLAALDVPKRDAAVTLDDQAALFRTASAGKRLLIVLDNAHDEAQLRALLPGSATCLVLVTSRNRLDGLVVSEGARAIRLDLPTEDDARAMLAARLGSDQVAAEPDAVADIIARCARLPLALAVAAAHPCAESGPAVLAARLRESSTALALLRTGDGATDVQAVLSWSMAALSEPAARLFRLAGLVPGPDLSVVAAASLAGVPVEKVRPLLTELIRLHLVTEPRTDRFAMHDLSREFAMRQAERRHDAAERAEAWQRAHDHYLHSAYHAAIGFRATQGRIALDPACPGALVVNPAGEPAATAFFDAEAPVILELIRQDTARFGARIASRPWQLAWTLTAYLDRAVRWFDLQSIQRVALDAARRDDDQLGQAYALLLLARVARRMGHGDESRSLLRRATPLFLAAGEPLGLAHSLISPSALVEPGERGTEALAAAEQALELYESAGSPAGVAMTCNNIGYARALAGDYESALRLCERAVSIYRELGDGRGAAAAWDSLGLVHLRLGDTARAVGCYRLAIDGYARAGDRFNQADSLVNLGDAQAEVGNRIAAETPWRYALAIFEELGRAEADGVRDRLRGV